MEQNNDTGNFINIEMDEEWKLMMMWNKEKIILVLKGYEFGGAWIQKYCENIYFMRMEDNLDIIWGHFQSSLWKLSSIDGLLADWSRINVCDRL